MLSGWRALRQCYTALWGCLLNDDLVTLSVNLRCGLRGCGDLGERIMRMFAERKSVSGSISEMESGIFPIFAKLILVGLKRSGTGEEYFLAGMGAYPG